MRIFILASHIKPTYGLERALLEVSQLLTSDAEVQVAVLHGSTGDQELLDGLKIFQIRRGKISSVSKYKALLSAPWKDYDLLILAGTWVAIPWLFIGRKAGAPVLIWEHSLIEERMRFSSKWRTLRAIARLLYRRADALVTVSAALKDDLQKYPGVKDIYVIPNPLTTCDSMRLEPLSARYASGTKLVLVGSLTPMKRPHLAIEALARLDQGCSLDVIGGGELEGDLRALAVELGVTDRVRFRGYVEPAEVRHLMLQGNILVHTAVSETFGLVYVEAADAGLPVVSTESRLAKEMIPKFVPGITVVDNPDAIAEGIIAVSSSSFEESTWKAAAANRRLNFGREKIRRQWLCVIEECIASPVRGRKEE